MFWYREKSPFGSKKARYNRAFRRRHLFVSTLWSEWRDLNSRPHGPEPCALPAALHPDASENRYRFLSAFLLYVLFPILSRAKLLFCVFSSAHRMLYEKGGTVHAGQSDEKHIRGAARAGACGQLPPSVRGANRPWQARKAAQPSRAPPDAAGHGQRRDSGDRGRGEARDAGCAEPLPDAAAGADGGGHGLRRGVLGCRACRLGRRERRLRAQRRLYRRLWPEPRR